MLNKSTSPIIAMFLICGLLGSAEAQKADPPAMPEAKPADQAGEPAKVLPEEAKELSAEVIEVKGLVECSTDDPAETAPAAMRWTAVKKGEKLSGGTQIRTGLRSHLVLRFGDTSVVMVKRSTLAGINQFYRQGDTETVRLGLGYGAVRGGTSEGVVRSDFVVDSTVATLAKRGTEGWEFWVEPYTGRFRVSLAESGLVEALEKLTGQRRLVRPAEYVNHANIGAMWIKQDVFDRTVRFFSAESISPADLEFCMKNPRGFGVMGPGLGSEARAYSGRVQERRSPEQVFPNYDQQRLLDTLLFRPLFVVRPEGNFGMGDTFTLFVPESQQKAFNRTSRRNVWVQRQVNQLIATHRRR